MYKSSAAILVLVALCMSIGPISCTEDASTIDYKKLEGRWELIKGIRNQKQTDNLNGTYFVFESNGKMKTNLPVGPERFVEYALEKNSILQKHNPPLTYQVLNLADTALVLGMELRGAQFEMHFVRATESAPPTFNAPAEEAQPNAVLQDSTVR